MARTARRNRATTQASSSGNPGSTFSIVIGKSRTRTPVALNTAFATAAFAPQFPSSPDPLGAEHVGLVVEAVEQHGVDLGNVGVHRHQVPREIVVDEGAGARCRPRPPPCSAEADAEGHAADQLRARRLGVEDPPRREHAQHPPEPDLGGIRVHADLDEVRAVGVDRVVLVVRVVPHRRRSRPPPPRPRRGCLPALSFLRSAMHALYTAVHVLVAPNEPPEPAPAG